VTAGPLLDCWQTHIRPASDVVIFTYGCCVHSTDPPVITNEHKAAGLFTPGQVVPELVMPDGFKRSVAAWFARLSIGNGQPPVGSMSGMLTGSPGQFGVDGADVRQDRRAGRRVGSDQGQVRRQFAPGAL
jgi:hypothetical protein